MHRVSSQRVFFAIDVSKIACPCMEIPIYFDNFRVDKKKRGEKNEKEEMKQMMNTVHFLKIAHERDSDKIDKLSEMMEELLLFQRGKYSLTLVLIIGTF